MITKIKQIQGRVFERCLVEHGIEFNDAQGRILFVLWNDDNIPISELAGKTGLAKTTLTSMLDRLEASGHIQRVFDREDRRKVNIKLTDSAAALRSKYEQISDQMNDIFYEGFSESDVVQFETYLERILNNLTRKEKE